MPPGAKYSEMSTIYVLLYTIHVHVLLYNLYFFFKFCCNPCFFPDHWWRAICGNTNSTGPVYSDPVQYSKERVENIIGFCGIHHRHQLQELLSDRKSLIKATNKYGYRLVVECPNGPCFHRLQPKT